MFTQSDLLLLKKKGIPEQRIEGQLARFKKGFPFLKIAASASVEKGIMRVPCGKREEYISLWETYASENHDILKFVPASGAASRMFKNLFAFLNSSRGEPETDFEKEFFSKIGKFAFYPDLNKACVKNEFKNIEQLISSGGYKKIVENLLLPKGLNYGSLPKGLLKFHSYGAVQRTAMEEHLSEGALYARNSRSEVNIHFTVSPEHRLLFEKLADEVLSGYEKAFGVKYRISFSEQKSSTDTIAVDENDEPFREDGELFFRPGGHGALIENLNDLDADVVFIKNIDNVVPDSHKEATVIYKKLLGGILVTIQKKVFSYLHLIDSGAYSHAQLMEMLYFLQDELCVKNPDTKHLEDVELVLYIKSKLDRPIRVCGMVKNVGEPGGGPFFAVNPDGTVSLQILESSQIDLSDPEKKALFESGTHFNPVDLVCSLKDYKNEKFNLPDYVDPQTGFISKKSKNGRNLKALELPGLWNGAMSDWNTIFVEVPIETFNPVKTVNDLLRPMHQ